jgi:hypothetical protein
MIAYAPHVAHDAFRIPEDSAVDALQNEAMALIGLEAHQESVVDPAVAQGLHVQDAVPGGEPGRSGLQRFGIAEPPAIITHLASPP